MALEIVLIAAVANNRVIGKEGKIPWKIPEDLQRFKAVTSGHPLFVGRITEDSFPKKIRPLSGRLSYVITRQIAYAPEGEGSGILFPVASLEKALYCVENKIPEVSGIDYNTVFVIGGEQIYRQAMPFAHRLDITHVDQIVEGDTFFPEIGNEWQETKREDKTGYSFVTYQRK